MGVLLELSGSSGLALDRETVTDAEFDVWEHMTDWKDVESHPLDSTHMHHSSRTQDSEVDDCSHQNLDGDQVWAQEYDLWDADAWQTSPTSQVLIRNSTPLMDELETMGRIRYR